MELALWSLLGARRVDVLAWESFGRGWATDVTEHLGLENARVLEAGYGKLPDLGKVDFSHDVVFTWNGTTSGVRVPDGAWIDGGREGLTICDATSAAFAMELPWDKLDVAAYSWQKVLGGEAQHGMLILGPRAVGRLESHTPPWPLPKLFRLTKGGKPDGGHLPGHHHQHAVHARRRGRAGRAGLGPAPWAGFRGWWRERKPTSGPSRTGSAGPPGWTFLAEVPETRSTTSVCLKISDPWFRALDAEAQATAAGELAGLLAGEGAAYDIEAYRDAPPGLRLWAGATVERADLEALFPWLDWALRLIKAREAA